LVGFYDGGGDGGGGCCGSNENSLVSLRKFLTKLNNYLLLKKVILPGRMVGRWLIIVT
jgi:hypothetical protein